MRARHVILGLLLAGVAGGVAALLHLRFERGDVYPPGSSLRSDPLGARVLYEALQRLDGPVVERNLEPLEELEGGPGTTLLLLGVGDPGGGRAATVLAALARLGVRVVVTLANDASPTTAGEADPEPGRGSLRLESAELELPLEEGTDRPTPVEVTLVAALPLPARLAWRSPLVLVPADPGWRVVYARGEQPVLVERRLGRGSLVVASDTFFLANEGLRSDRSSELLAWVLGPARRVVFDEVHLGISRPGGTMALVRHFRLTGFFVALAVLAALVVWRGSSPLAPAPDDDDGAAVVADQRAASAALAHLLRRGLDDDQLVAACLSAWRRSQGSRGGPEAVAEVERLAAGGGAVDAVYRRIQRRLQTTRRRSRDA